MLNNALPALILYAKVPLPGMVKTRLKISGDLSNKLVVNIQKAMIQDILHCISLIKAEFVPILSYHPFKYLNIMEELVNIVPTINKKIIFQAQVGSNQAFRFSSAIASALSIPIINGIVIINHLDTKRILVTAETIWRKERQQILEINEGNLLTKQFTFEEYLKLKQRVRWI